MVSETVATPLEQEINGVDDMLYMVTQSTGDGQLSLTVTFALGTDLDNAQVLVQNRVAIAEPRLPEEVRRLGVTVRKNSPDLLMVIHLSSPDGSRDQLYISNYATLQVRDVLSRLDGVGDVQVFGARDYSMRIWLDPDRVAARNLTAGEVVAALRGAERPGRLGRPEPAAGPGPGAFQLNVETLGPPARRRAVREHRRQDRAATAGSRGSATSPGSSSAPRTTTPTAISTSARPCRCWSSSGRAPTRWRPPTRVLATMEELGAELPGGHALRRHLQPDRVHRSSRSTRCIETISEAVLLVVLVVVLFLQTWRAAVIPIVAIPVSLIGTFAVMAALGFSLNNLSLFGLVLAIGIVVDDAIVVVENVERNLAQGMSPREAAHRTMDEVGGALVAIALVLARGVHPDRLHHRHLRPVLPAVRGDDRDRHGDLLLRVADVEPGAVRASAEAAPGPCAAARRCCSRRCGRSSTASTALFDRLSLGYGGLTRRLVRVVAAGARWSTPGCSGSPAGSSRARRPASSRRRTRATSSSSSSCRPAPRSPAPTRWCGARPRSFSAPRASSHTAPFAGFDGATFTNAPNAGAIFSPLKPFEERAAPGRSANVILADLNARLGDHPGGVHHRHPAAAGARHRHRRRLQDDGPGPARPRLEALEAATQELLAAANQTPGSPASSRCSTPRTPKIYADIDRVRAEMLGVPPERCSRRCEVYIGSAYVNDFNLLGRTYRVTAQADAPFRQDAARHRRAEDAQRRAATWCRSAPSRPSSDITGPYRVPRYNLYPAAEVQGATLPGYSTGQALAAMERLAAEILPDGFGYEWTELALQEKLAGNTALLVFAPSVVFVFLVLAAQYESWLAAARGDPDRADVPARRGQRPAAARHGHQHPGPDRLRRAGRPGRQERDPDRRVRQAGRGARARAGFEAAVEAARTRLRPILMTSFAFILGVVPLAIATGAGAEMRQSLGTAVFFGMLGVTLFGLLFTPVFYVATRRLALLRRPKTPPAPAESAAQG